MGITDNELEKMRSLADDWLPDTCTIQTLTTTLGNQGGVIKSWSNTYTNVLCRLDPGGSPGGGSESLQNETIVGIGDFVLSVPYDQAIGITDRIVHQSKTYEVVSVNDLTSYRTLRRASLKRIM